MQHARVEMRCSVIASGAAHALVALSQRRALQSACVCLRVLFTARRREQHIGRLHGGRNGRDVSIVSLELAAEDEVITGTSGGRHREEVEWTEDRCNSEGRGKRERKGKRKGKKRKERARNLDTLVKAF